MLVLFTGCNPKPYSSNNGPIKPVNPNPVITASLLSNCLKAYANLDHADIQIEIRDFTNYDGKPLRYDRIANITFTRDDKLVFSTTDTNSDQIKLECDFKNNKYTDGQQNNYKDCREILSAYAGVTLNSSALLPSILNGNSYPEKYASIFSPKGSLLLLFQANGEFVNVVDGEDEIILTLEYDFITWDITIDKKSSLIKCIEHRISGPQIEKSYEYGAGGRSNSIKDSTHKESYKYRIALNNDP